ncbi:MAG: Smr/MutS family protein [Paludibacteraceae bacterium]|nr:Smr/MutS family protein [Paludibacteraceae bacterium]
MLFPDSFEHKIDFQVLRARLTDLCTSSLGRAQVDNMHFLTDFNEVNLLLSETQEMLHVLSDASLAFPRGDIHDLSEPLARIRVVGLFLDESELHSLRSSLLFAAQLEYFFAHLDAQRFPTLSQLYGALDRGQSLSSVTSLIDGILDQFGQLRDNASPELARIRRELALAQGSVNQTIARILKQAQADGLLDHDTSPTMREGRLVIPVPPAVRRKIGGIVHDESATGKTVFIEPAAVVEANNHIRQLQGEERRERARILSAVTDRLRPSVPDILLTSDFLAHVDFLRAKALFAAQIHAIAPPLVNAPFIDFREVRHPVLFLRLTEQHREVVPLSLRLGSRFPKSEHQLPDILVISGPNAGGKSVCLKTVALCQYMLQCGLLIPISEAGSAGIFSNIFIDIGDEQSISDDLSTYSSHLRNMKHFMRFADADTLFLIDEFGSGTEPLIGGAMAEATLCRLNQLHAVGIVTTHYTNLKHLADSTPGIVNGAMLYDRGALRPLFQLSVGQAGSSFAIEIAHSIGLPDDIISRAKELVGADYIDYDRSLQDIARDRRYWENKRQNIRQREKHLEERIAYYEQEIAGLKAKKKEIIAEANQQAADLLRQSNATIERAIREIKESHADKERTRQARQHVEKLKQKVDAPIPAKSPSPQQPAAHNKVLHDFRDLKAVDKQMPSAQPNIQNTIRKAKLSFDRTLDLRGLRADEALEQLIAYMDDAIMVAAGTVTILHGTGTGALKQLTRDYLTPLKRRNRIVDFHDGDPDRGGAGLTIVEI